MSILLATENWKIFTSLYHLPFCHTLLVPCPIWQGCHQMQKTLLYVGKRYPHPLMATSGSGNNSRLLFVTDRTLANATWSILVPKSACFLQHVLIVRHSRRDSLSGPRTVLPSPPSANAPYLCTLASGRTLTGLSSWLMLANQLLVQRIAH